MAEKKKYNSILISGRKDQTLTYSKYVKDEESGESVKESLDKKVNITDELTTQQIKDGAITNEKMAADSVGNTNLQDGSVSNEKLEDGSITNEKLAENSITKDKLKDNTIGVEKLDPELRQTINAATGLPENLVETIQNVDDTLKDHQRQLDDKQSQIDDKQQQITANDEDISLLQTRSTQMEETIKSIAATGGASQATAVTYDNEKSGLTAVNAQAAIDEVDSKLSNVIITDDEGVSIPTPFHVTSDVDFAWVLVDKANKPMFGLKRNGRFWSSDTKIIENKVAELSVKNSEIEETLRKVQYEVSIPSYYSEYLASKIDNINNINFKNSINSDNFIFVTDTHCWFEEEKSHILIPYIMRKTICNKCFYGGDVVGDWGGKDVVDKSIKLQMRLHEGISPYGILFNIRGNHDLCSRSFSDSVKFGYSQEQVANIMTSRMNQNKYVTNENDKGACYYYVDNTYKNIRYIVMDTTDSVNSDNGNETIGNVHKTQIIWIIKEAIMKIPSNYNIVILLHIPVVRNSSSDVSWQSYENVRTLCSAIGLKKSNVTIEGETFDFSHIGGKLLMVLGGHTHGDLETYIDNVLHVSTACDRLYTVDPMYYSAWGGADVYPVRKFGTIYEQLFDYVNIDLSANIIHFIRIGAGFDRHFHITPIEVEMGKSKQIDSSLLDIITWDCVDTDGMEYGDISIPKNPVFQRETASVDGGVIVGKKQGECMVAGFDRDNNREFWYIKIK